VPYGSAGQMVAMHMYKQDAKSFCLSICTQNGVTQGNIQSHRECECVCVCVCVCVEGGRPRM
jgi:hypothetical protein